MKEVFADTFFFLAGVNRDDPAYEKAQSAYVEEDFQFVTTVWVLTELADALSQHANKTVFIETLRMLRADSKFTIVPAEQRLFEAGVALYSRRTDKDWSLTDCISFVVMSERRMADALTGDRHFEQAGFNALLK